MAEALAVIGAFSSVLQVIECTTKVVSHTRDLLSAGDEENSKLKKVAAEYKELAQTSSIAATSIADEHADHAEAKPEKQTPSKLDQLAEEYSKLETVSTKLKRAKAQTKEEATIARLASECETESQLLLQKLGAFEIDPQAKGGKRLAKALKCAVKSLYKRKEVDKIRQNLHELNGQLATAILQDLYLKQGRLFELDRRCAVAPDPDSDMKEILRLATERKYDGILASLTFPELTERKLSIEHAYPATYEWALRNDSKLRKWLREDGGIFWIAGKAGSGKSTLMKFLYDQSETKSLLTFWAGERKLVTANFYFWYAGTGLQKSVAGLLRTVSYQILCEERDLIPIVFPERYESYGFKDSVELRKDEWTYDELLRGLSCLASFRNNGTSRNKFCLFIDGLDEYLGDHLELVALLRDLVANAQIKLCVSSRPWNAFRNTLGLECPSLLLEELSRPDIYHFTNERIRQALTRCPLSQPMEDHRETPALINEIVAKAEGVFLWVVLVVQSIARGITEGDPVSMLRHRVRAFPADLDDFFRNILERVDPIYKAQTCQSLKLAYKFVHEGGEAQDLSTFVDFWLIAQNPQGLSTTDFPRRYTPEELSNRKRLSEGKIWGMIARTRNMLCSACKDLLCIPEIIHSDPLCSKVVFLHRTVYDFLKEDSMQRLLNENIPEHFKTSRIIHLLNLVRMRFIVCSPDHGGEPELDAIAQLSLTTCHQDLTGDYVDQFVMCVVEKFGEAHLLQLLGSTPLTSSICLALRSSKIGRTFVMSELNSLCQYEQMAEELWIAVLGEHEIDRFELDEANFEIIRRLCHLLPRPPPRRWSCEPTSGLLYLRKWARLSTQGHYVGVSWEKKKYIWRHFWSISKVLIIRGIFNLREKFCTNAALRCDSDAEHEPTFLSVSDFLISQVPENWLLEINLTSSLVNEYTDRHGRHHHLRRFQGQDAEAAQHCDDFSKNAQKDDLQRRKRRWDSSELHESTQKRPRFVDDGYSRSPPQFPNGRPRFHSELEIYHDQKTMRRW